MSSFVFASLTWILTLNFVIVIVFSRSAYRAAQFCCVLWTKLFKTKESNISEISNKIGQIEEDKYFKRDNRTILCLLLVMCVPSVIFGSLSAGVSLNLPGDQVKSVLDRELVASLMLLSSPTQNVSQAV